jgi:putative transposase
MTASAADAKIGQAALDAFAQSSWGEKYPAIAQSWRRNWDLVIPFFAFVPRRRPQNYLHNERHRGAELQAASGHQNQRPFPI